MNKEHIAKQIIQDRTLGKKKWKWNFPSDLKEMVSKFCDKYGNYHYIRTLVGFSKWRNTNEKYICIAQGKELIYLEKSTIKEMWGWVK